MKKNNSFLETQRFDHPLLLAGFLLLGLYLLKGVLNVFYRSDASQSEIVEQLIGFSIYVLVIVFFMLLKLKTKIDSEGVSIQFYPFHSKFVTYKWEDIEYIDVRNYRPLRDFGGWGVRYGKNKSKAFSTRGNVAIYMSFKTGGPRLIGTQKEVELNEFFTQFPKLNKLNADQTS